MNGGVAVRFLAHQLRWAPGKLLVVRDGAAIHRTIERRRGAKMAARGIYKTPVCSSLSASQ